MIQLKTLFLAELKKIYPEREAENICKWYFRYLSDHKSTIGNLEEKALRDLEDFKKYTPLQYITHEAHFFDDVLHVDKNVLIPRPETEELCYIAEEYIAKNKISSILDVGTGSGCIPLRLKKKFPYLDVHACDISAGALAVAQQNAEKLDRNVHFYCLDFLEKESFSNLPTVDLLISNPPYITANEANKMGRNVLEHEPHLALFSGMDPLIFYRRIVEFSQDKKSIKAVFCELNEHYAGETAELFSNSGFQPELHRDLQGKLRVLSALR
jgi:release factor glutamine methyltransferase